MCRGDLGDDQGGQGVKSVIFLVGRDQACGDAKYLVACMLDYPRKFDYSRVQHILKRIISMCTEESVYNCGIPTLRENELGLWLRQRAPGTNSRNEALPYSAEGI